MFALGLLSWMYGRPTESTIAFLERRFAKAPDIRDANVTAFNAGWNFGETTEAFVVQYEIKPAPMPAGTYRNITGNLALAYGLIAGAASPGCRCSSAPTRSPRPPTSCTSSASTSGSASPRSRPRTRSPASAPPSAPSFGGALGVTTTSGPGIALKSETIGLAVMTELPLLVVDVQRGGPSTGLPTKTEQADLLQAMFGRNGESPVPIVAPQSPGDCFDAAVEAARIAITYRTPVMLLSDGMLANGSEPWQIPDVADLPVIDPAFATETNHEDAQGQGRVLALPARRGDPGPAVGDARHDGLEHRIGGLEKGDGHGNISYDPANHDFMVRTRAGQGGPDRRLDSRRSRSTTPRGEAPGAGARLGLDVRPDRRGVRQVRDAGHHVAQAHLRHLNPFPTDLGDVLTRYERVMIPEMNLGQLSHAAAGEVPRRRGRLQPRARPAARGRRARRGDHDLIEAERDVDRQPTGGDTR